MYAPHRTRQKTVPHWRKLRDTTDHVSVYCRGLLHEQKHISSHRWKLNNNFLCRFIKNEIYLYIHEPNANKFYSFDIIILKFDQWSPIPLFNISQIYLNLFNFLTIQWSWDVFELVNFGSLALKKKMVIQNHSTIHYLSVACLLPYLSSHLSLLTLEVVGAPQMTIPFHPSMSSAALRESPNPIPVHSLMLSSHLFFCFPLLLAPFTVPWRIVFAMPEDLEMWPYHLSFRFFTMVRRSSCTPIAFWILLQTSSFVTWSL